MKIRFAAAFATTLIASMGGSPSGAQSPAEIAEATISELVSAQTRRKTDVDKIRTTLLLFFHSADLNGDGITGEDHELAQQLVEARRRAEQLRIWISYDLDGDGVVTQEELRDALLPRARKPLKATGGVKVIPTPEQIAETLAKLISKTQLPDPDGDGRTSLAELYTIAAEPSKSVLKRNRHKRSQIDGNLDRDGSGTVESGEFEALLEETLNALDANADGKVSPAEKLAFKAMRKEQFALLETLEAEKRKVSHRLKTAHKIVGACELQPAPAGAEVTILNMTGGLALSTVYLDNPRRLATVADIRIEPGETPLYLAIAAKTPVILRFDGAVDRIVELFDFGKTPRGYIGLPRKRINFTNPDLCGPRTLLLDGSMNDLLPLMLEAVNGRPAAHQIDVGAITGLSLPGGELRAEELLPSAIAPPSGADAAKLWSRMLELHPGGLVEIDPIVTVSAHDAVPYPVWPKEAGLAKLVSQKKLRLIEMPADGASIPYAEDGDRLVLLPPGQQHIEGIRGARMIINDNSRIVRRRDGNYYRLIPGVFEMLEPSDLPAALGTETWLKFRLAPGLQRPENFPRGIEIVAQ